MTCNYIAKKCRKNLRHNFEREKEREMGEKREIERENGWGEVGE